MLSSTIHAAADPYELQAAVRPSDVRLMVAGRGRFEASITRIDLHRLWLQRGRESLPRIWHAGPSRERSIIGFLTGGAGGAVRNGMNFPIGAIAQLSSRNEYWYRTLGEVQWAAMSLPIANMAEIGALYAGRDVTPKRGDEEIRIPISPAMARLQRLHAVAGQLAVHAPQIIAQPEPARGLEQALIEAMVDCLVTPDCREDSTAMRRHALIMRRFHSVLEASDDCPVYMLDLCDRIGVSGRTLRQCCQEHFGMGPKRYLVLRRMHLAHRALRRATVHSTTVTQIATQFGFWELGRFAVQYKRLFSESPSQTLSKPA